MTTRRIYMELRYEQRSTLTELVCFELEASSVAGMTDDEIMGKYGQRLTVAAADGGMTEPEADDWDWDRDSLELTNFELGAPRPGFEAKRSMVPAWVPELCAARPQYDNPLRAPDYRQMAADFENSMKSALRNGNVELARTCRDAADAAWKNAEELEK